MNQVHFKNYDSHIIFEIAKLSNKCNIGQTIFYNDNHQQL